MMGGIFATLEHVNENTLEALKGVKYSINFIGN